MDLSVLEPVIVPAITGAIIASAVNTLVTLLVQFVPGVRTWFASISGDAKRTFFALLTLAVGVAAFGYSLVDPATQAVVGLVIPPMSIIGGFIAVGGALASLPLGESIFFVLPKAADVTAIKEAKDEAAFASEELPF